MNLVVERIYHPTDQPPVLKKTIDMGQTMTSLCHKQNTVSNVFSWTPTIEVKENYDSRLRAYYEGLKKTRSLIENWTNEAERDLEVLLSHVRKFEEIELSDQQVYSLAQCALQTLKAEMRKLPNMKQKLFEELKKPPKPNFLHHLKELSRQEKQKIQQVLLEELKNDNSPLNRALVALEQDHIQLEAFIQLAFNDAFHHDRHFRLLFDKVWSVNSLLKSINSWDGYTNIEMPLIQINDTALPALEDLQKAIFNQITEPAKAPPGTSEKPQQKTGYSIVDASLEKLHLFEAAFLKTLKPEAVREEL
jgi:hypothetical protein